MMLDEFLTDAALAVVIAVMLVALALYIHISIKIRIARDRRAAAELDRMMKALDRFHNPFDEEDDPVAAAFVEECGDR
jgi:hypothetical protein